MEQSFLRIEQRHDRIVVPVRKSDDGYCAECTYNQYHNDSLKLLHPIETYDIDDGKYSHHAYLDGIGFHGGHIHKLGKVAYHEYNVLRLTKPGGQCTP